MLQQFFVPPKYSRKAEPSANPLLNDMAIHAAPFSLLRNSGTTDSFRAASPLTSLSCWALLLTPLALMTLPIALRAVELPAKKVLNLAAIKTMVATAEAEAAKRKVEVTICIVDESGNLLFLEKADGASLNTIQFAQKKARHAAFYRSPSAKGAEELKKGNVAVLAFPEFFPNQGGLPIQVDGQTIGGVAASGAASEIDEAIAQAALDALLKK